MKLCTFQPLTALNKLEQGLKYVKQRDPEEHYLLSKIFNIKQDVNARARIYVLGASMPQVLLYLDVPKEYCMAVDNSASINKMLFGFDWGTHCGYDDYLLDYISPDWLEDYQVVSSDSDPDVVQKVFLKTSFPKLEELSGFEWYNFSDLDTARLRIPEDKLRDLITSMMYYLRPMIPHINCNLQRVLDKIKDTFIIAN